MRRAHGSVTTARPAPVKVVPLRPPADDAELVAAMRRGEPWAQAQFFDRQAPAVARTIRRLIGHDPDDVADAVHETFVAALAGLPSLREDAAVSGWLRVIAARTAYRVIRKRRLARWLFFWQPNAVAELGIKDAGHADPVTREAARRAHALIASLPARERTCFVMRYVEGLELTEVAAACEVSLATMKRWLARAQQRIERAAEHDDALRPWLQEGGR